MNKFCCPVCKGLLITKHAALCCETCRRTFPIVDGIPDFFIAETEGETIDAPNQTWLDPDIAAFP